MARDPAERHASAAEMAAELRRWVQRHSAAEPARRGQGVAAGAAAAVALSTAYRRGMLTNLLNPKAYAFMLAVFPQFVRREWGPVWLQAALLGAIIVATQFSVYGTVVLAAARARAWLAARPRALAAIGRSVGLLLLAVALFSAIEGWRGPG